MPANSGDEQRVQPRMTRAAARLRRIRKRESSTQRRAHFIVLRGSGRRRAWWREPGVEAAVAAMV
jgi:hypothetical protein